MSPSLRMAPQGLWRNDIWAARDASTLGVPDMLTRQNELSRMQHSAPQRRPSGRAPREYETRSSFLSSSADKSSAPPTSLDYSPDDSSRFKTNSNLSRQGRDSTDGSRIGSLPFTQLSKVVSPLAWAWDQDQDGTEAFSIPHTKSHISTGGTLQRGSIYSRPRLRVRKIPAEERAALNDRIRMRDLTQPEMDRAHEEGLKLRREVQSFTATDLEEAPSAGWTDWIPGVKTATALSVLGVTALGVGSYMTGTSPLTVLSDTCIEPAWSVLSSVASGAGSVVSTLGGYLCLGGGAVGAVTAASEVVDAGGIAEGLSQLA